MKKGFTLIELIMVVAIIFVIVMGVGWFKNIGRFVHCDFKAPYKAEVIRGIGIPVVPLGAIAGWVTIKDN